MGDEFQRTGRFDPSHKAFIDAVGNRTRLHRYCSRMVGSVLDGEDIMQEVLFEAYRKIDRLEDGQSVAPWLFRIAHNRCIDFIRKRAVRMAKEAAAGEPDVTAPVAVHGHGISRALERLVIHLPPKERACVLLKDVFDYSLEEISELVATSVGGVKSALHRGRAKLAALPEQKLNLAEAQPRRDLEDLLALYVERFNRGDWDGIRDLVSADARLIITNLYAGPLLRDYYTRFEAMPFPWRLVKGRLDGERVLMLLGGLSPNPDPTVVVRMDAEDGKLTGLRHYTGCPWIFSAARTLSVEDTPSATVH